ncbi:antA/AntB antirepressor family protein [Marinomonas transparens]|uniref:AntA/AntB antirepressor family protein n=1 Tax=Marinomonas transparens TaxID=2795388 RepID=A0A934JMN7_9GAMM|nr:antA/AntB antirepressor family protein [Marinomonas transparens]MBJ7538621.1 antA/AntB antirepressor family protein [Marinomonas transparens]
MANQWIPLYTCLLNGQPADTVSARDLYTFLQLDQDFFHWVDSSRIKLSFTIGEDFILVKNLIRPTPETQNAVQPTVDYFIRLDMAYEMAMEEEGYLAQQAGDYLRGCDTPQNRPIPVKGHCLPEVRQVFHQTTPVPVAPRVKPTDVEEYRHASKALKTMGLNENGMALPMHEVSKIIETMRLYQDNIEALKALSSWFEQHIANLKTYANSQFMDG